MTSKTYLIQGRGRWCKVVGAAPPGYNDGPAEWSFDLFLDEKGKNDYLRSHGDKFYLKTDKKTGEEFIRFTRKAIRQDGAPGKPIRIIDHHGDEWDQSRLIGNDSILNVRYTLNEVKSKGVKRLKPSILAIQVWDHKKYQSKSDFTVIPKTETEVAEKSKNIMNTLDDWNDNLDDFVDDELPEVEAS